MDENEPSLIKFLALLLLAVIIFIFPFLSSKGNMILIYLLVRNLGLSVIAFYGCYKLVCIIKKNKNAWKLWLAVVCLAIFWRMAEY